ncbi:BQ2448_6388 [Microbotryum intermedium]|uniref:BQ2448_6388 protein n=1 Tax=Microbotryum intermedium TaxID=269621 RepID=A0A238FRV9_9BASI|nr:BQ2448_6388 [Microbotryum intermedium]
MKEMILRQLVLSSINLSVDHLKALCRIHGVEGYSSRHMVAKELFLRIPLWACDPGFNRRLVTVSCNTRGTEMLDLKYYEMIYRKNLNFVNKSALPNMRIAGNEGATELGVDPADDPSRLCKSRFACVRVTQLNFTLLLRARFGLLATGDPYQWNEYFTDANFRIFCCVVCSERVFGQAVGWVPESHLTISGSWTCSLMLDDARIRPDLRPKSYDFNAWRSAELILEVYIVQGTCKANRYTLRRTIHHSAQSLFPTTGPPTTPARSLSNGFYRAQEHVPNDIQQWFSKDIRGVYSKSFTTLNNIDRPNSTFIRLQQPGNYVEVALGTVAGETLNIWLFGRILPRDIVRPKDLDREIRLDLFQSDADIVEFGI